MCIQNEATKKKHSSRKVKNNVCFQLSFASSVEYIDLDLYLHLYVWWVIFSDICNIINTNLAMFLSDLNDFFTNEIT